MKTQTKSTLLLLTALFAIIVPFSGYVYLSLSKYSNDDFNRLLEIRVYTAARSELDNKQYPEVQDIRSNFFEKLPNEKDYYIALNEDIDLAEEAKKLGVPLSFFEEIIRDGDAEYDRGGLYFLGIKYLGEKGEYIVIASAENYFELHHSAYLFRTLVIAILISLVFSLVLSFYFSKYIFRPLRTITEKVKQISSENLHLRLDRNNKRDELQELTVTFNDMLDRIETSFETQNNFISNASHELRTPLTAIIGEADVALSKLRQPDEYIETIKVILDEAEKLDKKTRALLYLAQTGFDGKIQRFEKVRMDQLLYDVKETIEKINPKARIQLDMSLLPENPMKLKIKGNTQLMHLALSNIISNAVKYSNNEVVFVSIGASDDKVFIAVKDKGIGIPQGELKYIYDPFFRASNTKSFEGYGIGLPLSLNIIRMHQGEIIVDSIQNGGTTVQIRLPIGKFEA